MPAPIKLSIDIKKLKRSWMKDHTNGATYCEIIVYENDEPDRFGNEFSVKQGMSKEAREAGEKAGYIGNGKRIVRGGQAPQRRSDPQPGPSQKTDDWGSEEIPF